MPVQQAIDDSALLALARQTIATGLEQHCLCLPDVETYSERWREDTASFVTLKLAGDLRGCIGTLEAVEPLVTNVARNAYNAAFNDPRFPPLTAVELPLARLSVSLLTAPEPLAFTTESDLLEQLQPHSDGLIIERGQQHATFLPTVWDSVKTPVQFLQALKQKAGLSPDTQPERAWRYRTQTWQEPDPAPG
ncbi:AmmeMemoRadiSam system protein A [Methylohalomonas lacus]|uniref:AmmeMemoRadiSam system protein A n=1 Tax=Methylohalomonas lacus TaxID=398773 RepID=A0AAE3HJG3_9GAMM|nr:AmmeMemoRadiSam system protein A [Methylohalomonas lacus]MCS3903499.1 AmmeMemoRadiSam system protein A [Methylohalomonas lacus]